MFSKFILGHNCAHAISVGLQVNYETRNVRVDGCSVALNSLLLCSFVAKESNKICCKQLVAYSSSKMKKQKLVAEMNKKLVDYIYMLAWLIAGHLENYSRCKTKPPILNWDKNHRLRKRNKTSGVKGETKPLICKKNYQFHQSLQT